MTAVDLDKIFKDAQGGVFFSPTKGYHCDLMLVDDSWVHGTGKTIFQAIQDALKQAEKLGVSIHHTKKRKK